MHLWKEKNGAGKLDNVWNQDVSRSNQIPTSFGSTLCRLGASYLDDGVLKNISHIPPNNYSGGYWLLEQLDDKSSTFSPCLDFLILA